MEDTLSTRSLLAARAQVGAVQQALTLFAQTAQEGGNPASLDDAEVAALRREYVFPVIAGLLNAAAQFAWVTAPTDGTVGGLLQTMLENAEIAALRAAADETPPGEYWIGARAAMAGKGGERG
jgi:hypothetical protein